MSSVTIGSARHDEHGACYSGGTAGDQTGQEVSTQAFYVHNNGWNVLRPKSAVKASLLAQAMRDACNNPHLGYDQDERLGVIKNGIHSSKATECDCSSLVRACVMEVFGADPGNFTTEDEAYKLEATTFFMPHFAYTANVQLCTGDVLVTKTKGHTAIVTEGKSRTATTKKLGDYDMSIMETKKGSEGQVVKAVQLLLNGKSGAKLAVDGEFGDKTDTAVKVWQKKQGLTVDGIVGKKTMESLVTK